MYIINLMLGVSTNKLSITEEQWTIELLSQISNRFDMTRYSGEGLLSGGFLDYEFSSDEPKRLTVKIRETGRRALGDASGRAVAISKFANKKYYDSLITRIDDPESEV